MRGEDEKAQKQVCEETRKAEERAGRENSPALAQLVLLSSRAPTQAQQGSWVGTLRQALQLCTLCSLNPVFLKVLSIKQKYLVSGILPSTEQSDLKL